MLTLHFWQSLQVDSYKGSFLLASAWYCGWFYVCRIVDTLDSVVIVCGWSVCHHY